MMTFLGVRPSDVCEWDTKASASDPRVRERLASDRRCRRGEQAAEGGSEPLLHELGWRLRYTRGPGLCREEVTWQLERDKPLVHEPRTRKAHLTRPCLAPVSLTHQGPSSNLQNELPPSDADVIVAQGRDGLPKRQDVLGLLAFESLAVKAFDELRKRGFPRLLRMVVDLPEFFRVHPELSSHLNLHVCQPVTLLGFDPGDEFLRNALAHRTLGKSGSVLRWIHLNDLARFWDGPPEFGG
jgi:hypothetical protein